jgi:hypothetical protein
VSLVRRSAKWLARAIAVSLVALLPCSIYLPPWHIFTIADGHVVPLGVSPAAPVDPQAPSPPSLADLPGDWYIADLAWADVTNDGSPELALLVWRPWRDWPIQRWVTVPSPISGFQDEEGLSCQVILIDPASGREIWAGSALPKPLLTLDVGDVDGDGRNELVALEGDYSSAPYGAATHLDIWRWQGFGFILESRSRVPAFHQAGLTDRTNDGILDIALR